MYYLVPSSCKQMPNKRQREAIGLQFKRIYNIMEGRLGSRVDSSEHLMSTVGKQRIMNISSQPAFPYDSA